MATGGCCPPLCGRVTWLGEQSWNWIPWSSGSVGLGRGLVRIREGGAVPPRHPLLRPRQESGSRASLGAVLEPQLFFIFWAPLGGRPPSSQQCPLSFLCPCPRMSGRGWQRSPKARGEKTTWTRTLAVNTLPAPASSLPKPLSPSLGPGLPPRSGQLHENRAYCSLLCCRVPSA